MTANPDAQGWTNPSAFPSQLREATQPGDHDPEPGMSLRDWFAGQALVGLLSNPDVLKSLVTTHSKTVQRVLGEDAYKIADTMLAERSKA